MQQRGTVLLTNYLNIKSLCVERRCNVKDYNSQFKVLQLNSCSEFNTGKFFRNCKTVFNPLSANPTKWLNTLKQFVGKSRFVGLMRKRLKSG